MQALRSSGLGGPRALEDVLAERPRRLWIRRRREGARIELRAYAGDTLALLGTALSLLASRGEPGSRHGRARLVALVSAELVPGGWSLEAPIHARLASPVGVLARGSEIVAIGGTEVREEIALASGVRGPDATWLAAWIDAELAAHAATAEVRSRGPHGYRG
jgi:hypothetical protein